MVVRLVPWNLNIEDTKLTSVKKGKSNQRITFVVLVIIMF